MARAFEGIRVADFTQVLSGPYLTAQLALEGADVIKVEPPGVGDQMRNRMIPSPHASHDMASAFLALNLGKRSLAVDLKDPRGQQVVQRLLESADVVAQNFRGGVAERLGLSYQQVCAINPKVVYCQITGFGAGGPRGTQAAYDGAVQAASGMMATNGHAESGPTRTGYFPVDLFTGMSGAFAVAAALFRRERTGESQFLDVSMLDAALNIQAPSIAQWLVDGFENTLIGNASATHLPTADAFECSDGSVLMSATAEGHVKGLFTEMGLSKLLDDDRFATTKGRLANKSLVRETVAAEFLKDSAANWAERLGNKGVPIARINRIPEAVEDPQLAHRGTLIEVPAPEGFDGPVTLVGPSHRSGTDGPKVDLPPPGLGEHTAEVLAELGFEEGFLA